MKTIVAYTLKGEDHTAELVAKQGLFWLVYNDEKGEHRIPAKAVDETWEEAEDQDPAGIEEAMENGEEALEEAAAAPTPSLADQAMAGPTVAEPSERITLAELCDTYGVVPRIARRQLRAAVAEGKLEHDHRTGWTFLRNPENIDSIMHIITARKRG